MSAGAQDWRASLGGREALPGPAPPPALRRSPPARRPRSGPSARTPLPPVALLATPESFGPAPRARSPAAPSLTARGAEQRAQGGGGRSVGASAAHTAAPAARAADQVARGGGRGVAPAGSPNLARHPGPPSARLPARRRRRQVPPRGVGCLVSRSRCHPRRGQSLAPAGQP